MRETPSKRSTNRNPSDDSCGGCLILALALLFLVLTWPVNVPLIIAAAIAYSLRESRSPWQIGLRSFLLSVVWGLGALTVLLIAADICGSFGSPNWVIQVETWAVLATERLEQILDLSLWKAALIFSALAFLTVVAPWLRSAEKFSRIQTWLGRIHVALVAMTMFTLCSPLAARPWRQSVADSFLVRYQASIRQQEDEERRALAASRIATAIASLTDQNRTFFMSVIRDYADDEGAAGGGAGGPGAGMRAAGGFVGEQDGSAGSDALTPPMVTSVPDRISNVEALLGPYVDPDDFRPGDPDEAASIPDSPDAWQEVVAGLADEQKAVEKARAERIEADERLKKQVDTLKSLIIGKAADIASSSLPDLISALIGAEVDSLVERLCEHPEPDRWARAWFRQDGDPDSHYTAAPLNRGLNLLLGTENLPNQSPREVASGFRAGAVSTPPASEPDSQDIAAAYPLPQTHWLRGRFGIRGWFTQVSQQWRSGNSGAYEPEGRGGADEEHPVVPEVVR